MRTWFQGGLGSFRFTFGLNDLNHFQTKWLWFPACNSGALTEQKTTCLWILPTFNTSEHHQTSDLTHSYPHNMERALNGSDTQAETVITSFASISLDNANAISPNKNIVHYLGSTEVSGNVTLSSNRARFLPIFYTIKLFHTQSSTHSQNPDGPELKKIHLFSWHPNVWNIYSRQAAVHRVRNRATDALSAPFFSWINQIYSSPIWRKTVIDKLSAAYKQTKAKMLSTPQKRKSPLQHHRHLSVIKLESKLIPGFLASHGY